MDENKEPVNKKSEKKAIQLVDNETLMPMTINGKFRMAQALIMSGLLPKAYQRPEQVIIALQMGHELGLKPMMAINNIHIIDNKPTLGSDLLLGLAMKRPDFKGYDKKETDGGCEVTVKREVNGSVIEYKGSFTLDEAKTAGLISKKNWQTYPKRMLEHRARAFALRTAYPDVFAGLYAKEEMEDSAPISEPDIINVTTDTPEDSPSKKESKDKKSDNEKEVKLEDYKFLISNAKKMGESKKIVGYMKQAKEKLPEEEFKQLVKYTNSLNGKKKSA